MSALYSEKIFEKSFTNKISKQAYLDACKWLAQNVYGKGYSNYLTIRLIKKKTKKPTFVVEIFVTIDEVEVKESFCSHCKKIQTIFYCIEKPKCDECKLLGYLRHRDSYISVLKKNIQEAFEENEEWDC